MVNSCLILGYKSLDKITGIIFIVRQGIPRNNEPSPFLIIGLYLRHPLTYLRCRLGLIVLIPKLMTATYVSPHITHNQGVHDLDIFISGGIFGAARPSIILNALSSPHERCCPFFFHCAIRRGLLPKGFHKIFMNFLGRHSFLTEGVRFLQLAMISFAHVL